jgi:hypothetical protein
MIAGSIEIQLMANIARLQRDMDQARQIVSQTTASMTKMAVAVKEALAGMLAGFSLVAIGNQIIGAQRQFDKLNASLITATGSGAAAAQTFKELQAFAATTPYGVADATEAFVKLKNLGLDPSQAALRSYGNTAAAMGKGLNQMVEAVADAATGEFERLKEFGITAAQNGDRVSLTFKGITKTIGKNSDEIQAYLKKIGDTDFAGSMALRAATLDGAISNLGDAWEAFLLKISQSGVGHAASAGITVLANNLDLLAGTVATLGAARLASILGTWITKTYEEVAASAAARAATLASMEATVAETTAKVAQLGATEAMIVVAREEAAAKLASSNSSIAAARAALTAAEAAGAQSFALRTVRLATAELQVAEAQRSAMLAELAVLGQHQASVSRQIAAAKLAEKAAQDSLTASTAAGAAAAGIAGRALGLLGGPIGAIVTVLGLAATAWSVWGNSAKEGNDKAVQSMEETAPQMLERLNQEIQKLKERKALLEAKPEVKNADAKDQAGAARLKADLEAIKASVGEYEGQSDELREMRIRIVSRQYDSAIADIEGKQKLQKDIVIAGDTTMASVRQRLTGVNQEYLDTLQKLSAARDKGIIKDDEYVAAVSKLARDTFEGSAAGKLYSQSLDMQSAAVQRAAEAQGLLNQRRVEHIQFLKATGQVDDAASINSTAAAQIQSLNDQIKAQEKLRGIAAMRQGNEKEQADITGRIASLNIQVGNAKAKREEDIFALEQQQYRQAVANSAAIIEKEQSELASLQQQTQAQADYNEQIGLTPKQIAEVTAARLRDAAARKDAESIIAEGLDLTGERAARIRAQAAELRKQADGVVAGAVKQEMFDKNLQDLNAMVDVMSALDEAAQSAAQGMASAFGSVGQAIGGLTTALSGYQRTQTAIAAQLAGSIKDAHGDPVKIQRANQMAAQASAQAQIKSYGDMGAAAKGFFKENTAGYRAMEGVEKTFRAFEMAMALRNMAEKLGLLTSYTAASVTGKQMETQAAIASVAPEVAAAQAKGLANAAAGVANQAGGDPYTAWPRMAAMAAVMVGLGFAVSGGRSSVSLAEDRQKTQGTGSVLGDSDAKSESIKRALDAVEKNTYQGLAINYSMLATLRSIDTNIGTFASQLVRTTDITNPGVGPLNSNNGGATKGVQVGTFAAIGSYFGPIGAAIGALVGVMAKNIPILGKIATSIFGGKQSVEDSGFGIDPASLATIIGSGAHAFQYADIKTSGGWFSGDKHSEQSTPLDEAANQQFTAIIKSMADSVKSAGELLGLSGDDFTSRLNSFVVDIGHVSLKDLKGDDLQKALESVFSKLGDDMAQFAVGGLQELQQVGEGYLETLARVASEYQAIDVVFQSFGKTFGEVGLASIEARDRLVQLAGGLDKFTSQGEYFLANFFSEKEQAAALKARIDPMLAQYGLSTAGENATKAFRNFIVCLDTTTEAGAKAYTELMTIAPAFKAVTDAQQNALDEREDLQDQLDELTMSSTQLLTKQRDALDESNRALFDQVQAIKSVRDAASTLLGGVNDAFSVLQKATAREKAAIQSSVDTHTAAFNKLQSLSQALHSTLDSLKSPEQKLFARSMAQAEIRADLAITKAGGTLSDAQVESLKKALGGVTQDASKQFGSREDYMFDLLRTQNDIAQLGDITDDSLSVEQKSLDALNAQLKSLDAIVANGQAQIDALNGQSVATLSLAQVMAAFQSSIGTAQTNPVVAGTSSLASMYQDLLARAPDQAGLKYWQDILAGGTSLDKIREFFMDSDEFKKRKIPGFANGGDFGGGIRAVGEVGVEIEATGASRIHSTQAIIDALRNPSGNSDALAAEVRALREEVKGLRAEARATAGHSAKTAGLLRRVIRNDSLVTSAPETTT